jgi:hypothetical protein
MKRLLLLGIAALFLATGAAHAQKQRPIDEIVLDAVIANSQRPHPQEVAGAVHYAPETYPFPAALTADDEWAVRTTPFSPPMAPPLEFDHPYSGDLYIIDNLSPADLHVRCQHHAFLACASVHDTWCLIYIQRETDLFVYGGATINLVMRHEIGHCNGWNKEHTGARSFITESN